MFFTDRHDAGKRLAHVLMIYQADLPVVVGLPRGGVPVAYEVAQALGAPLDVMGVRKLGAPGNPEYGIGAVAEEGVRVASRHDLEELNISQSRLNDLIARETAELQSRLASIRAVHPPVDVAGRTVLLIDDGLATGITAVAAARAPRCRQRPPAQRDRDGCQVLRNAAASRPSCRSSPRRAFDTVARAQGHR